MKYICIASFLLCTMPIWAMTDAEEIATFCKKRGLVARSSSNSPMEQAIDAEEAVEEAEEYQKESDQSPLVSDEDNATANQE